MFKKNVVFMLCCILLVLVMASTVFAVQPGDKTKFILATAGISATSNEVKTADFAGVAQVCGGLRVWGDNIYATVRLEEFNNDAIGNFTLGQGIFRIYTRNPQPAILEKTCTPQIYGLIGGGVGHKEGSGNFVDVGTGNIGFGAFIPTAWGDFVAEISGYLVGTKWSGIISVGAQWGF
jgi:hypothetical protein